MAEQLICNQQVGGSIPFASSSSRGALAVSKTRRTVSVVSAADAEQPMGDVVECHTVFIEEERDGEMFARRTQP